MGNATISAVHFLAADLYSRLLTSTGFFTAGAASLGLAAGFQAPTGAACGKTVGAAGASVAVLWAASGFASSLTPTFLAAGVFFFTVPGPVAFEEVVGVGLVAEKVGAENSAFFFGGYDAVGARVLVLGAVFAALPASSPADDTVF